jgi:hypothetical protein
MPARQTRVEIFPKHQIMNQTRADFSAAVNDDLNHFHFKP